MNADGAPPAVRDALRILRLPVVLFTLTALLAAPSVVAGQAARVSSAEQLTLDAAVAEALEKNLELIAARAGVTVAQANVITAGLRPNPVLSVDGDHLDFLGTGFNDENGAGPAEYNARIDFLWVRGSKRARRIEVAHEERAIAEAEVLDGVRVLKLEVQEAFVDLQLVQEDLALARENAASLDEIVKSCGCGAARWPRSSCCAAVSRRCSRNKRSGRRSSTCASTVVGWSA